MPTPSDDTLLEPVFIAHDERSSHATCPPEFDIIDSWRSANGLYTPPEGEASDQSDSQMEAAREAISLGLMDHDLNHNLDREPRTKVDDRTQHQEAQSTNMNEEHLSSVATPASTVMTDAPSIDEEITREGSFSPGSAARAVTQEDAVKAETATSSTNRKQSLSSALLPPQGPTASTSSSRSWINSNIRLRPSYSSSFLRPGSKFQGTQQSDKQIYNVEVEIKDVKMAESFLCGYLRIEGLTDEHHVLTTYFEGELIGSKYTFQTKHENWGATEKTDHHHWSRFPAYRPIQSQAKKPDFHYKNWQQRENIFMRWKEYFLVPDHRVREISGASFEGFYYICFNQIAGSVSGIYFHAKSEKYQQLELQHVPDKGCLPAMEFR